MNTLINKIIYGGGVVFDFAKWIILIVVVLVLINSFWISIFVVDGESMEPGLHDGEVVLLDKSFYRGQQKPQRGDAVVVEYPGDPRHKRYVKRVIALPGETLEVTDKHIFIDSNILRESYIPVKVSTLPPGRWTMKDDEYFLMGDNRENSNDSRYFGPVEQRFFIGKATNVILPSLRAIEKPHYLSTFAKSGLPS